MGGIGWEGSDGSDRMGLGGIGWVPGLNAARPGALRRPPPCPGPEGVNGLASRLSYRVDRPGEKCFYSAPGLPEE
eukprot:416699-Hanusia_phi.AAC.1